MIKNVEKCFDELKFNIAVSQLMIYINECYKSTKLYKEHLKNFLILLSCFCPHLAEELNADLDNNSGSIFLKNWPTYDENKTLNSSINLPIQINGKLKTTVIVEKDSEEAICVEIAKKDSKIMEALKNLEVTKIIYVKNRILNFICKTI
jgi:leucyl-tRNA synthetase